MLEVILEDLKNQKEVRKNLIQMKELLKDEETRKELSELSADNSIFLGFLKEEDPKVRKNAALILGMTGDQEILPALIEAYENEETLFVKSDYVKAMQKLDCTDYLTPLKLRLEELQKMQAEESEKKHIRKERKELEKLLEQGESSKLHAFCGYDKPCDMILTTDRGFAQMTAEQIHRGRKAVAPSGVHLHTQDLRSVLNIRTFREILFPIHCKTNLLPEPEQTAEGLLAGDLLQLLERHLQGDAPYFFRMQILAPMPEDKKNIFLKKTAYALEEKSGYRLKNTPGRYEVEIRLIQKREGDFHAYLKFYTLPMRRFSYRKNALAVSINPTQAALMLYLAKPYLKEDAAVLDPFCGVGTMLIERNKVLPARSLYGIDIYGQAIEGARENTELAGAEISYIQKNFFDFTHRHRFDEIVTNMPTRGKKNKEEHDEFYAEFFQKAKQHLKPGGIIIMYTNESGFVKKQLRLQKDMHLLKEYCIRQKEEWYLYMIEIEE